MSIRDGKTTNVAEDKEAYVDNNAQMELCEKGEEKFGFFLSRIYALTSRARRKFYDFIVRDISSINPACILDIGCGAGDALIQFAQLKPEVECFGIDPSPDILKLAQKKLRSLSEGALRNLHFSLGSCRFIPFDKKFDLIFSSLSFHHWNNREQCIPLILEKLSEHGTFAIYEYNKDALPLFLRIFFKKHTLFAREIKEFNFDGYEKKIELEDRFLCVKFKKT